MELALQQRGAARWVCMIGNAKRWKDGALELTCKIDGVDVVLSAFRRSFEGQENTVEFTWSPQIFSFSEILLHAGVLPLPPYMQRDAEEVDKIRYNTVYAEREGSVAAPTAGLHFTPAVFANLERKKIHCEYLTLHVGAGTFKPVKSESMKDHEMHAERIYVTRKQLQAILDFRRNGKKIICVGTTSLRTLESVYWWGVKILGGASGNVPFDIDQWEPYEIRVDALPTLEESFSAIMTQMELQQETEVSGLTRILIVPGYSFKVIDQLITNFHQPQSTLLLLVAAFIGSDWRKVYDYAMEHEFRFLSYGDSSLLSRTTG
jgi:S-adenosylmethionine:tRNA ribosyltransferase-isomerase